MQPLGNKILVRDITEKEVVTEGGIILDPSKGNHYRKVVIENISPDSQTNLKPGDVCLANPGGVELEKGLWLCREDLLDCKL
jgi:co-chaperonin GroES (HSP10)